MKNRKKFLVYPEFQKKLIIINFLTLALVLAGVIVGFYLSYTKMKIIALNNGFVENHPFNAFLFSHYTFLGKFLIGAFLSGAFFSTIINIYFSHRLVGPLWRLKKYFEEISTEEKEHIEELKFRDGDSFSELPEIINNAIKKVSNKRAESDDNAA